MAYYVKDSFLNGRSFTGIEDLNAQARHWLSQTSNARVHATSGRVPLELRREEKLAEFTSVAPYRLCEISSRKADFDGFVRFESSRYSIPPEYAGQTVLVGKEDRRILDPLRRHDRRRARPGPESRLDGR